MVRAAFRRWLCVRRRVFCGCTYPLLRSRPLRVPPLRRVTLEKPQSNQRALAPDIRCLAVARHPLAPVLLRGPAAIGHPWPGAANPASMPGCPLRRTSTRPHEGAYTATAPEAAYRPACSRASFVWEVPGRLAGRYRRNAARTKLAPTEKQKQSGVHPRFSPLIRPSVSSPAALDLDPPAPSAG